MEPLLIFLAIYVAGFVVGYDDPRRTMPSTALALITGFLLSSHVTGFLTPTHLEDLRALRTATAGSFGLLMGLRLADTEKYDRGIDFLDTVALALLVVVAGGIYFVSASVWQRQLLDVDVAACIALFVAARARPFDRRFGDLVWLGALVASGFVLWHPAILEVPLPAVIVALASILALVVALMLGRASRPATATLAIATIGLLGCALGPLVGAPAVVVLFLAGALLRRHPGLQSIRPALREVERPTAFALLVLIGAGLELDMRAVGLGAALAAAAAVSVLVAGFIRGVDGIVKERFLISPFALVCAAAVARAHGGPLATLVPLAFALGLGTLDVVATVAAQVARWRASLPGPGSERSS